MSGLPNSEVLESSDADCLACHLRLRHLLTEPLPRGGFWKVREEREAAHDDQKRGDGQRETGVVRPAQTEEHSGEHQNEAREGGPVPGKDMKFQQNAGEAGEQQQNANPAGIADCNLRSEDKPHAQDA